VTAEAIRRWVEQGGVLLRFAGPRLAREASLDDPLLPVALKAGDRTIGGALSWTAYLIPFLVAVGIIALAISRAKKATLTKEPK